LQLRRTKTKNFKDISKCKDTKKKNSAIIQSIENVDNTTDREREGSEDIKDTEELNTSSDCLKTD
jgi:hypothetical protein